MSYDGKNGNIDGLPVSIVKEQIRLDERRWVMVIAMLDSVADLNILEGLRDQYRSEPYVTSSCLWVPKDRVRLDD